MDFDACHQQVVLILIRAAELLREAKGLPKEHNITVLYKEVAPLFGMEPVTMNTQTHGNHLPAPHEMVNDTGKRVIPLQKCPRCSNDSLEIFALCNTCSESEGGKYKTKFSCILCKYEEKSEKFMTQWLNEWGVEYDVQSKESLGIKTITDDGIK